ncbi:MAG: four helix bundle protein [Chitinophagaceae bacterium]|nr:four helix bundle protein [Chitinophagaceae bacterium]
MNNVVKNESIIATKAYSFALGIITLYKYLVTEKKEFVLSKQLLRSGTSIGANINEALSAQSKRDFVHKLSISLKEARETSYWLNLLKDSEYIKQESFTNLSNKCNEILKILSSIILTTKQKYFTTKGNINS